MSKSSSALTMTTATTATALVAILLSIHHPASAFTTSPNHHIAPFGVESPTTTTSTTALHVSMASTFLRDSTFDESDKDANNGRKKSPTKNQTLKKNKNKNNTQGSSTRRYQLHSNNISELTARDSTADDVMIAIKRARNLHDVHDILVVGNFLLEGVGDSFAYGYKGSLLAAFAVTALRLDQIEIAQKAIRMRQERHMADPSPFESASLVRALNRADLVEEAFALLEHELGITENNNNNDDALLKHRALSLASIASRSFYKHKPVYALKACQLLSQLGPLIVQHSNLTADDLDMPWARIRQGATHCAAEDTLSYETIVSRVQLTFPVSSNSDADDDAPSKEDSIVQVYS